MLSGPIWYAPSEPLRGAPAAPRSTATHETFIHSIRDAALAYAVEHGLDTASAAKLRAAKLVYGYGGGSYRGICVFGAWTHDDTKLEFVEIAASAEESDVQLAGTTVHELGHVLAGWNAGHGSDWRVACSRLGLLMAQASGQAYAPDHFAPTLWAAITLAPWPGDGRPRASLAPAGAFVPMSRPKGACPMGQGTRGGTSRGKGSGSRLRLYHCECLPPVKVRVASDDFQATCNRCAGAFTRQGKDN